ncbi:MAG: lipoyl(octanoyl) transferase LipB [Gemmatimonadaceae bacterium]|nr:lipoyl(octanoyl) transferase LipB [Gemmatimonadaceae bacterium]
MLLQVRDLGLVDYDVAWALQKQAAADRISGALAHDTLFLVQHPPVVTLGRSSNPHHLLTAPDMLTSLGIQLRDVERGGDVTVHEPGQLVAYPVFDLKQHTKDLHWYLRQVEAAIMHALASVGLEAGRQTGQTGVWREGRKLASIGVHARDWVTWHGVALNVENDLKTFNHIVPCGIDQVTMTSVKRECEMLGAPYPGLDVVRDAVIAGFASVFSFATVRPAG